MQTSRLKLVRGISGALVVGTLGFGAVQAAATPAIAAVRYGCQTWQAEQCTAWCQNRYGPLATGDCGNPTGGSYYSCRCVPLTEN